MFPPSSVLGVFCDTGAPPNSTDYITVVLLHGYGWHSGGFKKLIPLAAPANARLVLVDRRDYPLSKELTPEEVAPLNSNDVSAINLWTRDRARELFDFLADFVRREKIPPSSSDGHTGGLVIAAWSLASNWIIALLSYVHTFPVSDAAELSQYVRRVIAYDGGYHSVGYSHPEGIQLYNPHFDPSLSPEEKEKLFPTWVSGYYTHGDTPATMELRTPLASPPPTVPSMAAADLAAVVNPPRGDARHSDLVLLEAGTKTGAFVTLREGALYLPPASDGSVGERWEDVEVRFVWCDQSVWDCIWTYHAVRAEVEEARKAGKRMRNISVVRVRGANHFAHWDCPEKVLPAFLTENVDA